VTVAGPDFLKQQQEEEYATAENGFAPELEAEMQRIETYGRARDEGLA
jgi:hypothetical protein